MLKYLFNRLCGHPTVQIFFAKSVLVYRAGGRTIELPGENMANGFKIDTSATLSWNDKPTEFLSHEEKLRIGKGAADAAAAQWGMRVFGGDANGDF